MIPLLNFLKKFCKIFFIAFGIFAFIIFTLSFTDVPYYAYYYLGISNIEIKTTPDVIVVLGGTGMPSPDGLIRTYYGSLAAKKYPNAKIIIALPAASGSDSLFQLDLMKKEMKEKGVDSMRISYEPKGFNTHSQAINIASALGREKMLLIVTSPEHVYRAVKTFQKAGFDNVSGLAAFENPVDAEMVKDRSVSRDHRIKSLALRYNIWSYMNYELLVLREYIAISYYKMKGWI